MAWVSRIVVPMEVEPSLEAVDLALRLAGPEGEITVVHVLPLLMDDEAGLVMSTIVDEKRAEYARDALHKLLAGPKYANVRIAVLVGEPGHEIADYAAQHAADLILLPSHRHQGIKRLLIGSVAERVVRLATCPVLVLKHPHPDKSNPEPSAAG